MNVKDEIWVLIVILMWLAAFGGMAEFHDPWAMKRGF